MYFNGQTKLSESAVCESLLEFENLDLKIAQRDYFNLGLDYNMADKSSTEQKINDIVKTKFPLNCLIVDNAAKHFAFIKEYLQHLSAELNAKLASTNKRYQAKYVETESNQAEIQIG